MMLMTRMRSLTPGQAAAQAADAAHDQVDLHAGLRGAIQRVDDLRIDERVHLGDDPAARPAVACAASRSIISTNRDRACSPAPPAACGTAAGASSRSAS